MTTTQEPLNGHRVSPPPCSTENPGEPNRADLPTNKANNNQSQFAPNDQVVEPQKGVSSRESRQPRTSWASGASRRSQSHQELSRVTKSTPLLAHETVAYHVPPERYAPKPDFSPQEFHSGGLDTTPLPERCQFMFSDGRQCSMARSDIHPSLCHFHSEREDQLFGHPTPGGHVVGRAFDLPELYSACRDLTTAAGVNRALGQVFRLLAQRRISRQEAATFGHLAQLLLRSISAARAEETIQAESSSPAAGRSEAPLLRPGRLRGESLSDQRTSEESFSDSTPSRFDGPPASSPVKNEHKNGSFKRQPTSTSAHPSPPAMAPSEPTPNPQLAHNQHLRNHGTSSHSESTLAEKRERE